MASRSLEVLSAAIMQASDTCYAVPGYPVTELAGVCNAEYVLNEKIALEYTLGDSLSGRRSTVIVRNAGMNILSDPLMVATVQGIRAGVVIIAGDDTELSASQTRQNSCRFGDLSNVPVFEPGADGVHQVVESALQSSETYSRVAVIRITAPDLYTDAERLSLPERRSSYGHLSPDFLTTRGMCEHAENITAQMRHEKTDPQKIPESYRQAGYIITFCRHCPYKPLLSLLQKKNRKVIADTGCSLLAKNHPIHCPLQTMVLGHLLRWL